jgi:hypothetical protein
VKCMVCEREASEKYCVLHDKAYRNVVQKFEDWKQAAGVSWKEYLKELVENSYTGTCKRNRRIFTGEQGWINYGK